MKTLRSLQVAALTITSFLTVGSFHPSVAQTFDKIEVNENNFIAVAAPFGEDRYQLLIIEQISNQRDCWRERGNNPVTVEPLLLNFDFTGICSRNTDSNGYSIRMDDRDLGLDYLLRVVKRDGELVLVGTNRVNRNAPEIEIGTTQGMGTGFQKIFLNSGWRLTRRTYQGRALGHIYLTSGSTPPVSPGVSATPPPRQLPPLINPPAAREEYPEQPSRELIFTKPDDDLVAPGEDNPVNSPQVLPPPPSNRTVPVFER
ncbi:MAG TPA: hypothetical protein DEG17_00065 [Cyanobacteria bacterium UBA11149]|nr:hypothetical protein [Cyanobacteria bacterium UBA11367]HBE60607.1 hypothetical protein [Cyanobacteria bacterium UBA11366]HBK62837.1 hypothetical protein [Cyanobacteria bacterium UBA11166]HBR72269.1 hypothetical protein [Cyanobacteria bacterium UBA11159]HBS69143.1 hypothetical protein [Cyanobacteria bacterium UBA11153]HBW87316.1 hypothetical protein [Cyanobacteria bacterium UBA11149]HCA95962.1 hypothetical protein [Cyanobacteria bacterium UBA9226]